MPPLRRRRHSVAVAAFRSRAMCQLNPLLLFFIVVKSRVILGMRLSMNKAATNNNRIPESPLAVLNPITKRNILLGGPKYQDFINEGAWVQHEGTLKRLDLSALRDYQQSSSNGQPCCRKESNHDITMDEWYCIMPSVLSQNNSITSLDDAQSSLLREQLLFVNKPAGLHCVPPRDLSYDSFSSQVSSFYSNAKPCHRLDRDTSGIMVFGLTPDAHCDVSKQFEARTTSKTYTALISGHPQHGSGVIDLPIGKVTTNEGFNRWTIGGDKPREAITEWRVDEIFTDASTGAKFSRVELEPKLEGGTN